LLIRRASSKPHFQETTLSEPENIQPQVKAGKARVLLVEDDKALRRYLEVTLERAGYEVLQASDGLEAMKLVASGEVDLVITDAMMPNLSGHELCRFMRNSPKLEHIPIVLLSGSEKDAGAQGGSADVFFSKPVAAEKLLECIARLLT
jgi:twitching motility two-component system response regulator PilH